jgi:uncharacterized protein with HEPN domain
MDERIEKWLHDILIAIEDIDDFLGDGPRLYADFVANKMLRLAVERDIEIIGEAMNRILKVDPAFSIPAARQIVNTRNYVIHAYDSLRPEMLWNIVIKDIPSLKSEVKKILAL